MNKKIKDHIKKLEHELLDPEVRKSGKRIGELLADDFFEFAKDGKKYNKKEIIDILPSCPEEIFATSNFDVLEISSNTVLVTYIADRKVIKTEEKSKTLCSSIWQERNGKWQMIFFQGTTAE
ncbi:MAG: hypothetical protein UT64_C0033G0006 [Candidatus Falkowbacteria bacterium GW2011_GWF2_39_8]|uniref:DUF4440 domain-containing protein n=1 Tax=Candidatus Falkowbacteria bacterium GW2011_GWF2_39_8 TaxID=1618642 RepID=A0A0G0T3Q4_9BACT|nr:MAG: hypothetical protein UT64_C0033G0006 [Candidatus Falkowbacteria bacterium GW2011_GWF2_39_8]